jgi:predicted dithiol-disulfide oxidoreductase (DUF899 family)
MQHPIVSREQWLIAREALLVKKRAMTHALDALRAERRQLPWVKVEKSYVFEAPEGAAARRILKQTTRPSDTVVHTGS